MPSSPPSAVPARQLPSQLSVAAHLLSGLQAQCPFLTQSRLAHRWADRKLGCLTGLSDHRGAWAMPQAPAVAEGAQEAQWDRTELGLRGPQWPC